jgi:NADPH-dependent glutamate synthase beta subunit-like oxidoreductase
MDYGTPFCNNDARSTTTIPDFNHLVLHGNWRATIHALHTTNNSTERPNAEGWLLAHQRIVDLTKRGKF